MKISNFTSQMEVANVGWRRFKMRVVAGFVFVSMLFGFVTTASAQEDGGLFPFTSYRKVVYSDIVYMSSSDLRIMRNEIYARHGYIFDSADLRRYFMNQSWYTPRTKNVKLSSIEEYNVKVIKQYEDGQRRPQGEYPFTSLRKLTPSDVAYMSPRALRIMRNEIYARHGYIFDSADLRDYFMSQYWYYPLTKSVNLSAIEKYNVEFIKRYE